MTYRFAIQRMQHSVASPIRGSTGPLRNSFTIVCSHPTEWSLVYFTVFSSTEWQSKMFKFVNCLRCFFTQVLDCILITKPIGTFDCVIHVPFPIILTHITKSCCNTTLCRHSMTSCRKQLCHAGCFEPSL